MRSAIEKRYKPHCQQKNCVQACPTGSSHYEDPATGCVRRVIKEAYDEERHFTVRVLHDSASLIAIDKCLISQDNRAKRCDCAFFTADKIVFVEFKLRQPGREREEDTRQNTRLEEAAVQLMASIKSFEEEGFITTHEVEAYAHVGFQPIIPAPTTTLTNLETLINAETRSFVELFATNEVTL